MRGLSPYTRNFLSDDLFKDFDTLFENMLRPTTNGELKEFNFQPRLDIEEHEDYYLAHADLPGLKEEDINVEVDGDFLTLSGERTREKKTEEEGRLKVFERFHGKFSRRLSLPNTVNKESIEANYENGVLSVYIPKVAPSESKTIKVDTGKKGFFDKLLGASDS